MQEIIENLLPKSMYFLKDRISLGESFFLKNPIEVDVLDAFLSGKKNLYILQALLDYLDLKGELIEDLERLHGFVGSCIEHDLGQQITNSSKNIPVCSALSLLLGMGRCGVKARVLADLMSLCGLEAGIIVSGHHVATFFELQGTRVLDCDIYNPGVIPKLKGYPPLLSDYLDNEINLNAYESNCHFNLNRNLKYKNQPNLCIATLPSHSLNSVHGFLELYRRKNGKDIRIKKLNVTPGQISTFKL